MNSLRSIFAKLPSGLLYSAVILSAMYGCGTSQAKTDAPPPAALPVIKAVTLPTTTFQDFSASVEGTRDVEIRPQVDGYLTNISIDEGDYVRKGQTLFTIDRRPYAEQLNNATANLQAATAALENAKINVDKLKPLLSNNVVSDVQVKSAEASYNSAKANVAQAQAQVEAARINLGFTNITAPSDGYVGSIPFKTGSLISRGMAGALTTISEVKDMRVYFSLSETDFLKFKEKYPGNSVAEKVKGMPEVELILADGSVYPEKGKVETVEGQFDKTIGAISLRASFPNAQGILRSGSTGKVRVPTLHAAALVIPQEATFELQDKVFVYTVADSNKIVTKPLTISGKTSNYYLVTDGVKPGDKIVLSSQSTMMMGGLKDGVVIQPQMVSIDSLLKAKPLL
ncbi:membrane fusion protein, multidrug efflux system [Chitinophaga jiangningensis]|uniref:Membrane fusion protein, multidrug efflux system n=1 Tax=Chitinophaga jiangningensis TaxID=1419482 RepID=A0A1M6YDV4_9BACT|nr:efflux RND transporter periplasmic adaptor subunit [Chitinophaga jiangningensis]SHL16467.1 membrane fusion protein, multidrug efflux system [Chitinophaga jiangningensis]